MLFCNYSNFLNGQNWIREIRGGKGEYVWIKNVAPENDNSLSFILSIQIPKIQPVNYFRKFDINGKTLLNKHFKDSLKVEDMVITFDDGYAMAGYFNYTDSGKMNSLPFLLKLDSCLEVHFLTVFRTTSNNWAHHIIEFPDNTYTVLANFGPYNNSTLHKLDKTGNLMWQYTTGGFGFDMLPNKNGSMLVGGTQYLPSLARPTLELIDKNGKMIWEHASRDIVGSVKTICHAPNGGYAVFSFGNSYIPNMITSQLLERYDSLGNRLFVKFIGDSSHWGEGPEVSVEVNDSTYILASYIPQSPNLNVFQLFLTKVTASGNVLKQKDFKYGDFFQPKSITKTPDGKYLLTMLSKEKVYDSITKKYYLTTQFTTLMKIDENLELDSFDTKNYIYDVPCFDTTDTIPLVFPKPNIVIVDTTEPKGHFSGIQMIERVNVQVEVFPNPTKASLNLEFERPTQNSNYEVLDITGRKVLAGFLSNAKTSTINLQEIKQGIYILNIRQQNEPWLRVKIVKQ